MSDINVGGPIPPTPAGGKPPTLPSSARTQSQGIQLLPLIIKALKTGGILLAVWLVGYSGLSLTWVLIALFGYVARKEYKKANDKKKALMAGSTIDEKEALLARVDELPSWYLLNKVLFAADQPLPGQLFGIHSVYFPDVERAEWLNKMIQQMWPFIGEYAKNLMINTIEPAVSASLPAQLTPFKFEKVDLGNIPPRIGGVKVYIENIKRDEIIMDMEITCATDADITVSIRGLNAGVKDVMLHGTLRVVMTPLVNQIPIIGGLSVFFLSQPHIDFDLTNVANVLDMPLLSTSLRTIISDQVANFLVLPNKIPITIIENLTSELQYPLPQGVIRIQVFEASQLKKADLGIGGKGKSDPYCKVMAGGVTHKTKVIDNTIAPVWNETFEFVISHGPGQVISFEVFDEDPGDDDKLGNSSIDVDTLMKSGTIDTWLTLENVKTGRIHVRATWLYLSKDPDDRYQIHSVDKDKNSIDFRSTALLMISVDSCKDLPSSRKAMIEPSPFVTMEIGNKEEKTTIKSRSTNPYWAETFQFLVADPLHQDLIVEVLDSNKENNRLGVHKIAIAQLFSCPEMTSFHPYNLKESANNATITLRLCLRLLTEKMPVDYFAASAPLPPTSPTTESPKAGETPAPGSPPPGAPQSPAVPAGVVKPAAPTGADPSPSPTPKPNFDTEKKLIVPEIEKGFSDHEGTEGFMDPPLPPESSEGIRYRGPPQTSSNDGGFGRIQLTIRYSGVRERLITVVHQCVNLIPCDSHNLADPYIKLYMLPDKTSKKTQTQKDNLNPVFDETFDWPINSSDIAKNVLSIKVKNNIGMFSKSRSVMGLLKLKLSDFDDLNKSYTDWYDLTDPDMDTDD